MGELTLEERGQRIVDACLAEKSTSPYEVFRNVARRDFVHMHGQSTTFLTVRPCSPHTATPAGTLTLPAALDELMSRGLQIARRHVRTRGACAAPRHLWELHSQFWRRPVPSRATTPGAATWSTRPARLRRSRA